MSGSVSKRDVYKRQALILTADALATEWIFEDGRALSAAEIGEFLRTRASVSAHERGYQYLCEAVSQNINRFIRPQADPPVDIWGRVDGDDTVVLIRKVFDSICTDGGFNPQALLSWLAQNGHIRSTPPHLTKTVRINGIPTRCVVLKLPQEFENNEEFDDYIPD